jgi:hypothetical protein
MPRYVDLCVYRAARRKGWDAGRQGAWFGCSSRMADASLVLLTDVN